jgi:hypothetical protein
MSNIRLYYKSILIPFPLLVIKSLNATLGSRQAFIRAIITSLYSLGINRQLNSNSDHLISLILVAVNPATLKS